MTKTLAERWGRFDVDFPNDDKFLAMPDREELRSKAYLVLLAMSGWSVLNKTDGDVPMAIFSDLCHRLWPLTPAGRIHEALLERRAKVVRRTGRGFALRKQSKWQQTNAEIAAAIEAGRRGASKRWSDHGGPDGVPHSPIGDPMGSLKQIEIEKKKEIEKEKETNALALHQGAGLCEQLKAALDEWGAKADISEVWRLEEDRLLRIDKRPPAEARQVLEWATHDGFWRPNIRSIPTFRKQYDQLLGQMMRKGAGERGDTRDLRKRAAELAEAGD